MIGTIAPLISKALDFIPNTREKEAARAELETLALTIEAEIAKAQAEVNKTEAAHPNLFVAGWRPFVGWICGLSLGWTFLLQPIVSWAAIVVYGYTGEFPDLDTNALIPLLMGMLGIGAMRSYDKKNKVDTKDIK